MEGAPGFLDRLDDEALALLRTVARPVSFTAGEVLVRHGQPAHGAYLLCDGEVEASVRLPSGDRVVVAAVAARDLFGDMALVERGTYAATVQAKTDTHAWYVDGADFGALAAQRSQAALKLQYALTRRLIEKLRELNASVLTCPAAEDRPARPPPPADPLAAVPRTRTAGFALASFLPRLAFFDGFGARDIAAVIERGALVELPRGQPVFAAGEPAAACYLVLRGAVELISRHGERERRIAVLGPGQLLGFMSALGRPERESPIAQPERGRRSNEAYARESALLFELPRDELVSLCFDLQGPANRLQQALRHSVLRTLAQTNRNLNRLLNEARLAGSRREGDELEATYSAQIVATEDEPPEI